MSTEPEAPPVGGAEWVVDIDDLEPAGADGRVDATVAAPSGGVRVPRPGDSPDLIVVRWGPDVHRGGGGEWVLVLDAADRPLGVVPDAEMITDTARASDLMGRYTVDPDPLVAAPADFRDFLRDRLSPHPVGLAEGGSLLGFVWPGRWAAAWTTADPLTGTVGAAAGRAARRRVAPDAGFVGRARVSGLPEVRERVLTALEDASRPLTTRD